MDPLTILFGFAVGVLVGMTGVDAPYEAPVSPEMEVSLDRPLDRWVDEIYACLDR